MRVAKERAEYTASEVRVARLVARGATNREAATALGLSAKTVEWHLSRLYRKVGVRSRTELALAWRFSRIRGISGRADKSGPPATVEK